MNWRLMPAGVLALYALHRLALRMETKGWIYYAHWEPSLGALGKAVPGVQQMLHPGAKHTLEIRRTPRVRRQHPGGPPEP